jgi:hypothetical protein
MQKKCKLNIFSLFNQLFWVIAILSKYFLTSTYFASIISISFHITTYFSSIFVKSFHYSTYLSSVFLISAEKGKERDNMEERQVEL